MRGREWGANMITSKYIPIIVIALMCVCLGACGLIVYAADVFDTARVPEYQARLFGDEVITLDVQVEPDEWQALLDNAQAKEWISADVMINGERFSAVGIRTKGNSSLSMGRGSDNSRYSLQCKLNKYVKGQTYYGLDTFCVNNMMGDATYMKEYLSYELMNFIGVETPLVNYANVTVNGEDYGFCVALERYDKAFLDRAYGTSAGQLYNVKIQMGMRGNFEDMWQDIPNEMPNRGRGGMTFGNRQSGGDRGFGGFGRFGGSGGGSLVYTDSEIGSYASIFDNAVFNSVSDKDKQRVVTAIENLNDGTDLEKYFDVDEILRYFAAHTVLVNLDSYTSNMQQNYYIYERDGKITILPWDYGLAFGGFQSGNASSVVNFPIDTPVSGVNMEDRPLLNKLLEVEEYRERYHEYLRQIVEGYFESGLFESTIHNLDAKIGGYVKNDASALYTYEQYEASLPVLIELGRLRAESVKGQLDGTIPSTSSDQNADSSLLTDASAINLSALGSMMGGGGEHGGWSEGDGAMPGGWGGQPGGRERQPGDQSGQPDDRENMQNGGFGMQGGMFDMELMRQAMQIIMEADGELTDEVKGSLLELGLTEEMITMFSNMQNGPGGEMFGGFPGGAGQNAFAGGPDSLGGQMDPEGGDENMPRGMDRPDDYRMTVVASQNGIDKEYAIAVGVLLILLIGATAFVAKPRKTMSLTGNGQRKNDFMQTT